MRSQSWLILLPLLAALCASKPRRNKCKNKATKINPAALLLRTPTDMSSDLNLVKLLDDLEDLSSKRNKNKYSSSFKNPSDVSNHGSATKTQDEQMMNDVIQEAIQAPLASTKGQVSCPGCTGSTAAKRLINDLLEKSEYDSNVRPVKKEARNVTVHFGAALAEVENLVELGGKVTYRMMLKLWWNDFQLQWNPEEYGGVSKIHLSSDQVWIPDIGLYNGVESKIDDTVRLTVFSDGDVLWMPPAHFTSTCRHEFRSDSWQCPLLFRSWAYTDRELDIKPLEGVTQVDLDELYPSAHWALLGTEGKRVMKMYPCCEDPYPTMEYLLKIRNKIGHPALLGRRRRSALY